MNDEKKPIKIIFAPGCFDTFEGTQDELNELMAEVKRMAENGEFVAKATPVPDESLEDMDLPPEVLERLQEVQTRLRNGENPEDIFTERKRILN